jgi:hypothetical protein
MTESDTPFFLRERYVRETCRRIHLPEEHTRALVRALVFFEDEPQWIAAALKEYEQLFGGGGLPSPRVEEIAVPDDTGEASSLYLALVFLAGVPNVFAYHVRRGIPEDVTAHTLSDLATRMDAFRHSHEYFGLRTARWVRRPFGGVLYRLGRLQFEMIDYRFAFRAYHNRDTREVALLAESGNTFRSDGRYANAAGGEGLETWTTELIEEGGVIRGTMISRRGEALREPVTLEGDAWECVLRPGDAVVDVHIPVGGRMDFDACGKSFRRACEFFPRHFPEYPFQAFTCHSWFLDRQLEEYLGPGSNIIRFMRHVYLHPSPGACGQGMLNRTFGGVRPNPATAPRDTSLRRAVIEHLEKGGEWYDGSMMLLVEEVHRFVEGGDAGPAPEAGAGDGGDR